MAIPAKVDTPDTFKSSNVVCPSTSISLLTSTRAVKVDTPATLRSSKSVLPSTSISQDNVSF